MQEVTRRASVRALSVIAGAAITVAATAGPAAAQNIQRDAQNAKTIGALVDAVFQPFAPFNPNSEPLLSLADYTRRNTDSREGIAIGLGNALASFPLGASSAGFTYELNSATGERTLKAISFGPVFVDRAISNGKGVLNVGLAYQGAAFDTLQGIDLKKDGFPIQSQLGTFAVDGSTVGDSWRTLLDVKSNLGLFSGSYGVTDKLDVGWAVPFVSLKMHAQFVREYNGGLDYDRNLIFNGVSCRDAAGTFFANCPVRVLYPGKTGTEVIADRSIDASGIGDVVLRAKYSLGSSSGQRVHVSGEVHLPTGDDENLIGAGKTAFRLTTGGSVPLGDSAFFNINGGYTGGGLTSEINFSTALEAALLPSKKLTMTAELIGQNLRDTVTETESFTSFDQTVSNLADGFLARRVRVNYGFWDRGSTTLLRGAIAAKFAVAENWLITGSALFRLNDNGYQAKIVPFIGLERTFSRR